MIAGSLHKLFVSTIEIIIPILLFTDCSSSDVITIKDFKQIEIQEVPDNIWVITRDSSEYHFIKPDYYVEDDTLFGERKYILNDEEHVLVSKITRSDIESIRTEKENGGTKFLIIGFALVIFIVGIIVIL